MPPFDDAWLEQLNPRDALRVLAAWDRLRLHTPASQRPIAYLHQHTHLPIRLLTHLHRTRTVCAHPHLGPISQTDLDRALVTAYHALARLTP
ncbi:hypothetical protein ACFZAU_41460 [Streptomyces sp. NPDC008238]